HGLKLKYNKFTGCTRGWQAVDMTSPSEFLGWAEDCSYGIDFTGNADANLFVYSSTFEGCGTGVYSLGDGTCAVKCSDFNNNDYGHIYKINGSLKIDNVQNYTRLNSSSDIAGYNNFGNATQYSIFLQEVDDFAIEDGYNSFIMNPNPSNYVFDGSLNYGALDISNNYWEMQSGGSTVNYLVSSYFSLVDYSNSNTAVTLTASPNLSSNVIECARWDGETVSDGDWNVFAVRRINAEKDKNSIDFLAFEVFPIPADNELILVSKENIESGMLTRVKVIDITGREFDLPVVNDAGVKTRKCDVSQLGPGVYLLIVEQKGQVVHKQKIVITH
ncbi:MAG: T9SS type A sorting domain-containing protein, partial [Bacteroidia bacterium]|nr:T9SS type A sorting domain-containing protein [Bacteroidia bacterium]